MRKLLLLCGMSAAVIYVGTVILGGLLRPGYSHIAEAISELVAAGAPNRSLLSSLFLLYNLLASAFGVGIFLTVNSYSRGRVSGIIGSLTLVLVGIAGILMELAFPQEPGGTAATFSGTMHFVMAGIASLGTMLTILMLAFWFRRVPNMTGYVAYSLISVALVSTSGGLTAAAMAIHHPLFGLVERITIFAFTLWLFVIGRKMLQLQAEPLVGSQFEIVIPTPKGR
jgi:hypothetical protein